MSSAVFHFGAKKKDKSQEEYDLVLDNQIEFIQAMSLAGTKEKVLLKNILRLIPAYKCNYLSYFNFNLYYSFP